MSRTTHLIFSEAEIASGTPSPDSLTGLTYRDIPLLEALWTRTLQDLGKALIVEQMLEFLENMIASLRKAVNPRDVDAMADLLDPDAISY